ncbi:hypothetical protein BDV98DRAFT_16033 [Pterulicium gracile]|uniref:Karyogamy protein 5 n=1 Tax=Pterulicium gracile TaxID=1884261 RepID=A0A5C3R3G5_9AGAR|nr:hypothetical protein BDV98DRAFT_16033 [Pterula gracilis]
MHFLHALRFIGIHHAIAFALSHSDVTLPQDHALTSRTNEEYQNTLIAIRDYLDIQPAVSDCMENSQIDYSRLCIDSAMDYQFRDRVAIIMTLCELSTSEYQPAPMECTEAGFSNKKCMNAFMRSPQQWTTYSSHMHNIRNSCYRYQREHDIDIARELYRNATEGQIEFLRASHEQQLAVLQVSDTTYRQVQTMENSLDIFQERISQLEMLLSGDIYVRLEAVIGALEKVAKDAIPSVFRDQMLHLEHFNKEQNAVLMKGAQQVILFLHESIQHSMEAQEQRGVDTANKLNYGLRSALFQLSKDLQTASYSMQREFRQGVTEISSDMVNQQQVMKEQVEQSLVPLEAYTSVLSQVCYPSVCALTRLEWMNTSPAASRTLVLSSSGALDDPGERC